jgi:hypothetical protein
MRQSRRATRSAGIAPPLPSDAAATGELDLTAREEHG